MKQPVYGLLTLSVVMILFLVGCTNETPETTEPATPVAAPTTNDAYPAQTDSDEAYPAQTDSDDAYPAQTDDNPDPYPSPESDASDDNSEAASEPFVAPTPSSGEVGNVTGRMLRTTTNNESVPVTGVTLYLGNILETSEGVEGVASLNKSSDPQAMIDAQGHFVFTDVALGRYGLWLGTVTSGDLLLKDPETLTDMIIEVTGGKHLIWVS